MITEGDQMNYKKLIQLLQDRSKEEDASDPDYLSWKAGYAQALKNLEEVMKSGQKDKLKELAERTNTSGKKIIEEYTEVKL